MLRLLRDFLLRRRATDARRAEEAWAFLDAPPASMTPVQPPKAANDDVMADVYAEVERELRVAGLIR